VAVGVNCTAPRHVRGLVERIRTVTDLPILAYPNSGEGWDARARAWTGRPDAWLDDVVSWVRAGARVVGGCCRVGPDEIREVRRRMAGGAHELVGPQAPT
jgi:homocysteine S-methyltransferase